MSRHGRGEVFPSSPPTPLSRYCGSAISDKALLQLRGILTSLEGVWAGFGLLK